MLPPVAEVYVVWHPGDLAGQEIAQRILDHFHGTPFSGLIGGAVEVYARSHGWRDPTDAPRPIPLPGGQEEDRDTAELVAIVPVLDRELVSAVEQGSGPWWAFMQEIADRRRALPHRIGVFPIVREHTGIRDTVAYRLVGEFQELARYKAKVGADEQTRHMLRDLTQGMAQLAQGGERLRVFISHTYSASPGEPGISDLIASVRAAIQETRLREFFDASTLQPGEVWPDALRRYAATSAMLAVRTDHYASRAWCQEEMLIAKRAGMPVVILDALTVGDERGSFLMDHVPRVPVRSAGDGWRREGVLGGLALLVDECLKRALWRRQRRLAEDRLDLRVAWWAPHAPEPATLADWLTTAQAAQRLVPGQPLRIIHPDPPLGPRETEVLAQLTALAGVTAPLEVMTPRSLAARGG